MNDKPCLVVDTNVFVAAAFNPRSASAGLVADLREGRHVLVWNGDTRAETKSVLSRIPKISWDEAAELFRDEGRFEGATDPDSFSMVTDPGDRKFAALAAAAQCPLVSRDEDLLEHRGTLGIEIFSPAEFARRRTRS